MSFLCFLWGQYKIEKKVREAHRKSRKLDKLSGPSKMKKDMGVPNLHPFKEQLLEKAAAAKARKDQQMSRQKDARRNVMDANRGLQDLATKAQARSTAFDLQQAGTEDVAAPGTQSMEMSRKQYYQEVKKVVDASDVILEVIDARDPLASRSLEMESRVKDKRKKLVLLLNKVSTLNRRLQPAFRQVVSSFCLLSDA